MKKCQVFALIIVSLLLLFLVAAFVTADEIAGSDVTSANETSTQMQVTSENATSNESALPDDQSSTSSSNQSSNQSNPTGTENQTTTEPNSADSSSNSSPNSTAAQDVPAQLQPLSISVVANPSTGNTPLTVQFTAISSGTEPLSYSWDFNGDGRADNTQQNPSTTFSLPGEYNVTVTVHDATGASGMKKIPLSVTRFDSHLNITSYFPTALGLGNNQITLLIQNDGTQVVNGITAKIIGQGIEYISSSSIATLSPGDKDSLTVKINMLQTGALQATAKVLDKNILLELTVAQQVQYNKEELQAQLQQHKDQLQQQELVYYEKKSRGFLVQEAYDNVKNIQKQIQDTDQKLLKAEYADANINLYLIKSAIEDVSKDLETAIKPRVTLLMWIKDNAVAIAAIIAALGTIGGLLLKVKHSATKAAEQAGKLGKEMVNKKWFKKAELSPAAPVSTTIGSSQEKTEGDSTEAHSGIEKK